MKQHRQPALPDYRNATLTIGGENTQKAEQHFKSVLLRNNERTMLEKIFGILDPPETIGGRKLTKQDLAAYVLALNYARGTATDDSFLIATRAQTQKASVRFFQICAAAMQAVKAERAKGWNSTEGHRMAALQAKLELETHLGSWPTQKKVKARAFDILMRCKWRTFEPLEPKNKRWSKILSSVNLDYLPRGVRGKGG